MDKKFIEQAKTLRMEYFKSVKEISRFEAELEGYKKDLEIIQNKMNENDKKEDLLIRIVEFEKKITQIEDTFSPQIKKIKDLELQADRLFDNIKTFYPAMSLDEIKAELIPHLEEINLKL